ncbi:MAG: hypothetical protein SFW09_19430 [Hyphomicrobiaceae bacterium]|nr:hypothetical protein [Hyphomicrobiaceae bacterium]
MADIAIVAASSTRPAVVTTGEGIPMFRKLAFAGLAGAFALAVSVATPVGARPNIGSSPAVQSEQSVDHVKGKKKKKKVKKSKAGKCGTFKYWSKKAKKCADARDKK